MKVEIISIGTELLVSDILDTNAAHISRSLREVNVALTSKVTIGDDPEMIADAFRVALRRADLVIATGGLGSSKDDFTLEAVTAVTNRHPTTESPGIQGGILLGDSIVGSTGVMVEEKDGVLVCLPGNRREMSYLLETEVLPYLQEQLSDDIHTGWTLLRCVGVMESSLKQDLADLNANAEQRITFDSFAGQTNIRLWAKASSEAALNEKLARLKTAVAQRLGDHVFGDESDRLETVVLQQLKQNNLHLSLAECYTHAVLQKIIAPLPDAASHVQLHPAQTWQAVATALKLDDLTGDNLSQWCRHAANALRSQTDTDLSLVVYSNVTQGGVQILVTLASPHGVSVTQRSFGGHPENIDQWALTLGLTHLRRWLMVHN
ncbi:competence/damage-inducible protein A [Candidatus Leptofilum sp.]|uniref:competence/damage-inducible protein A n=1 Tax=Candidatus Leptofilum sp. TaxID=3241576 RepID=UPI003B5C618D